MIQLFKELFCSHDDKYISTTITGATMTWGCSVTREKTFIYQCSKCSRTINKEGMYTFCDQKLFPEYYNKDGWPVDENGNKLTISN